MTVPTVACTNCGKNFTTDELRLTNCRYCGTLLAHHARAQQQVAVVHQMLADRNGNGIPDAYEGLVANAQANALNQAFGVNQYPYGGPPMGNPMMGNPMMGPNAHFAAANFHAQQVGRTMSKVMIIVFVSIALVTLLTVGLGVLSFFVLR